MAERRIAPRSLRARAATVAVCVCSGYLLSTSAIVSDGADLRPNRNTDLVSVVTGEKADNDRRAQDVARLREEVDRLTQQQAPYSGSSQVLTDLTAGTGGVAVHGPGVQVTLHDAPNEVKPAGVDPDLLVVHQQDIQAVMNILWASGAEAMMVQGQRIGTTTGIKCVGNTVVIRGIPYAPPYRIEAIGDPDALEQGLAQSSYIKAYQKFVDAYGLGYAERRVPDIAMPAYTPGRLSYARAK